MKIGYNCKLSEKINNICSENIDDFNCKLGSVIDKVNYIKNRLSGIETKYINMIAE